jgi:HPt (histidine-containing phosphotransfer) domain-containing protein
MDIESMAEDLGLEVEEVHRLVLTFLDSTEQDILLLSRAFSDGDAEKLRSAAHHINGAAANLELYEIAEAAKGIEDRAHSGILEDPAAQLEMIRNRLDTIRNRMAAEE